LVAPSPRLDEFRQLNAGAGTIPPAPVGDGFPEFYFLPSGAKSAPGHGRSMPAYQGRIAPGLSAGGSPENLKSVCRGGNPSFRQNGGNRLLSRIVPETPRLPSRPLSPLIGVGLHWRGSFGWQGEKGRDWPPGDKRAGSRNKTRVWPRPRRAQRPFCGARDRGAPGAAEAVDGAGIARRALPGLGGRGQGRRNVSPAWGSAGTGPLGVAGPPPTMGRPRPSAGPLIWGQTGPRRTPLRFVRASRRFGFPNAAGRARPGAPALWGVFPP